MLSVILMLFVFTPALDSTESAWLDTAFKYLNISKHDLEYPKIWVRDTIFITDIARRSLEHPLDAPKIADSIEISIVTSSTHIDSLFKFASELLGLHFKTPHLSKFEVSLPPDVPALVREPLSNLMKNIKLAQSVGDSAFRMLRKGEIDTLLSDAIYWWSDEDDSLDDTLRGVLNRELGINSPFAIGDTTTIPPETLRPILRKIEMQKLTSGFFILLKAVSMFIKTVEPIDSMFQIEFPSSAGKICLGGVGPNTYHDCALVVDFGGNDVYRGRCGGGVWNDGVKSGIVIDFGGDDVYSSDKSVSTGGGVLGYGLIVDMGGNDIYRASHVSLGSAIMGCAALIDYDGDDAYRGGFFTQGSGNFGIGILFDGGGNDSYRAYDFAQGMGGVEGLGLLLDSGGNDAYYAGGKYIHHPLRPGSYRSFAQGFALGWRPDFPGGIGLLIDLHGNDSYYSEIYGQGVSYWLSFAALLDDEGNDSYYGIQYMQGAGIHLSTGILIDRKGGDSYFSRYGPSQGEGHDLAVGWLIDGGGEDRYFVSDGQGVGLTNSTGFFIDRDGNDVYTTERYGQGWANWSRGAPGIGIFLDLSGKDIYPKHTRGKNNRIWLYGTYGLGIDVEK